MDLEVENVDDSLARLGDFVLFPFSVLFLCAWNNIEGLGIFYFYNSLIIFSRWLV